jgi:hypothetical protein
VRPTPFPELNELLAELVASARSVLGADFVGAYVTGSFAFGAGDMQSDCDFLIVTGEQVTPGRERALRAFHDEIPTRSAHWARNLEGSYAPRVELQTLATLGREWLYINRGHREMEWSTHCNREEHRWTLRERGIVLAGPAPSTFVAAMPPSALRARMPEYIDDFLPDLLSWTTFDIAWAQHYAVTSLCRMLYTLQTGEIASKPAALEWGSATLDPEWRELIQQVVHDRPVPWNDPPRPGGVERTLAFVEYARALADRQQP